MRLEHSLINGKLYYFMTTHQLIILLTALCTLTTPWCLRTALNVTEAVSTVDFSPDNTSLAVTLPGINTVYIYETTNFLLNYTYTPTGGSVSAARFTKNSLYLVVGFSNGSINIIPGKFPYSNAPIIPTYTPRTGFSLVDLATSSNNDKLLICYSNSSTFAVVPNFLSNPQGTVATATITGNALGCKFTLSDDVVIIDSANAFTFAAAPSLVTTCKSKINNSPTFTDLAVRNASGNAKILLAGGVTSSIGA
jgi:WD40 repeat protein